MAKKKGTREPGRQASSTVSCSESAQRYPVTVVAKKGVTSAKSGGVTKKATVDDAPDASSNVKKRRRRNRKRFLRPKPKVPPDLKGLESTKPVRSSSTRKSILKVQVPVPKEFVIHKIVSTPACSRSAEEIESVQVPVLKEIVKHSRKTSSVTEPLSPPVLPSDKKGTKKDSQGGQNGSSSNKENSTIGRKRDNLDVKEKLSGPGGKLRKRGEESTNQKLDIKSETEGTSRRTLPQTQSLRGKVFVKNYLVSQKPKASGKKPGGTGVANTKKSRKTLSRKMNANFTSGKVVKAKDRKFKATGKAEKVLLMVKETCLDATTSVPSKDVLADSDSGQKVDSGILSKKNVTGTLIENSVSQEVKVTKKNKTPENGTKCRSTMAGRKARNSSASDASKAEDISDTSTKREANVAGERECVKSENDEPKMSKCSDTQVNHTSVADKNKVNDKKDDRSSLSSGQSSAKPPAVVFDKAASSSSSSPTFKYPLGVPMREHMATTSANTGAVSTNKSTNEVSSTSENSDTEKSTSEKKSIEDELKQEDEDGPWVNDDIRKQIDLRNGAYKLFLKKRDEKLLNYYLRLKERIRKMIAQAKHRHFTGKMKKGCVGTVKQKALEFNEVVLVLDKQDEHVCRKLKKLCPRASYIYKEKIDYRNAFDSIKVHQSFGKKTLYVMMCGALTAVRSEVDPGCRNKGCPSIYRRYRLVHEDADGIYNHLVEHALLLRKNVEDNNTDTVIFLEIFLACLDTLESQEIKRHLKNCAHTPKRYFRHLPWKSILAAAFLRFNFWLVEDKEERGFSCLCLEGVLLNYLKIGAVDEKLKKGVKVKWHPLRKRRLRMISLAVQENLSNSEDSIVLIRNVPTNSAPPDHEMEANEDIVVIYEKKVTGNVVNEQRATEPSRIESQSTTRERQNTERPALQTVDKGPAGELRIMVIFDDQDSCLQGIKYPYVTSIFSKNFDFFSGHASVEGLPPNQNVLFMILCGIRTVVKLSMDPECMKVGCGRKLYRISPTLTDSASILKELVSGALLFRKRLTEGKPRHRVVFSGLLPPSLYHIDKYAVDNHYTQCNHKAPLHSKEYFAAMNLVLGDAVRKYNTWAKDDASVQGFLGWDIESIFTTKSSKIFHHDLEPDGVSLTPVCQEERKKALKGAIEYTRSILVPAVQESSRSSEKLKFSPTAITLVFDETQDFLANIKMPRVSYLNTSNSHIRFQDAHAEIKSRNYARERTLYVVFGGIETVFQLRADPDCKAFHCHSPLNRIELVSDAEDGLAKMLISCALSLKKEIESINKCKVIFCTLLPVNLKTVDEYAIREHLRRCKHQARYRPKGSLEKESRTLALAVDRFNTWARSDAHELGLCDWNVDDIFAGITVGSDLMFLPDTEVDGRCLTRKWQSLKTEVITASLEKTFDAIDQIKENEKEETSRSRPSTLTPNIQSSCSKAENHQFDHVVIVVNTLYRHILQDFQSSRVTVIGAEQLSFSQIPSLIKQHHYEKNKKVLWLLPVGIYSLTEFYQHPSCKRCARPLHVVTLGRSGLPSEEYMMNHNQDMLQKASTLDQVLQEELGPDAFVLFVPPIRAVVVVKEMFKSHTLLHRVCERNSAFCADAEVLIVLREYYNQFCEVWKSLVTGKLSALPSLSVITKYQMENQGQNVVPIADNEDYTYAVEIWKDMLKEFIRESLCAVQIDPESISTQSDKGKNILRKPPNRQSISEFQSGQTVGKNTLPRPRNRQSVSAVQSGQTTGKNTVTKPPAVQSGQTIKENTLPKPPNRQSISEVLSGQTIGKNTLPKPPNGQSSSEVQSGQNIGENTLPKPPNSQSIIAVQSGQTTRENTLPKPPNKQSISAVQSGQTIGENTLPKPPNRQSISAVQSGQTTRENTLPKPPNKQSISAVQSGPTTGEISLPKPPNRQSISEAQRDQTIGENTLLKPPNGQSISEVQSDQTIGKNTLPKPPSSQSISEVQSGQTTRENTLPKLPNRQSISEVQSGQTTRENTLPKPPNEQSISEVQGGQTIRENTSPNPPNKQSIIEVQSGQTIGENTLPKPPNRQSIRAVPSGQKVPLVSNTEKNDMFKAFNTMSLKGVETAQISSPALFNTGKEKQNTEGMSSTNVSKIEHIVVIGSKNLCARIESLQNQFPLTFIYENVDFSEECIKRCTAYQKNVPFRTAWIILMDISLLTKKSSLDTPCSNARCRNPFEYDILKADVNFPFMVQKLRIVSMVNEVLANGVSFAMNLVKELTPGSLVCFAPIAPLHGMIVQPATAHDRIHALKRLGPDVALLQGTYLCWVRCAKYLSKAWKNFMLENTSQCVIHDLLVKYYHNQNVRCIVPVHDDNTVKGNSIQVTRWRNVVTEMIKKIALTGGEYSHSSLGPFAVHPVNPKQTEAPSEKEVANASARQPQAKATAQAKVQQTAGPVLHPASNVPVASSSEKANRTAKAPQDLAPLRVLSPSTSQVGSCSERVTGTDGPSSAASTTPGGGTGNAVVNMNQSKSGGIVSTQPVTTVSGTSHEHSSCTTAANRGVSSDISHKALGSVSPITAKRKPNEPPIIQPKTSNQALNKDVINTVESTHGTSGMKDSRDVSGKTSSVTERPPLEEKRKNVLKSSSTVQEPHPLDNEKEHSVSLSSLKTCENASGRKQVCETNAVQSSKPNKNIEKIMFCSTIKTSGKSPGRSSNTVSVENEAATCVASQENASVITETCETPPEKPVPNKLTPEKLCNPSETPPEKPVPNKLTPEKLCNPSKLSLSKVSLEKPEVTSNLSPKKLPLEASENVTVPSEKCGAYVVSPNTLGNTGESAIAVESVPLDKGSSKIPSVPEATDKDKDTILSSSNQKAPDGTVASPTDDTSQARPCTGAVQDDSSSIELNQRPNTVVPTYPNEGQDLPASIPKDKQSSKRKPRAAVDSVSSDSEPISKASVVRDKVVSGDTNMTSSVSTAVPDASVVDTSVKVSNSKAVKEVQTSSANIVPLAKESCSRASSPKLGGTHNVTSKHVPSSVALVMQSRSGSPSSVNTLAKIPAPTCIVHPTKVDGNVLSSHKGTVAEAHSSPKTNSVTTAIPSGSGKYTLAVKDHGSVPLKMVSLNEGIPTAVVTPKINLQKNCTVAKPSSSKVEESLIVKDPSNQTTYGFVLTNIHRSIKDEDLKVLLGACGPVHSMQRPTNILGKPAEYCCVKFLSHDVALRAKQMFNAVILGGNPLEVKDLGNYAENSSENALQADRLLYHELEKIAMKCKVNLSLKDEMLIQYSTQERLEGDQLPNPSNGSCSNNKEYDNISLSSVSLSSLEDSDHDKSVSGSTGRKIYSKRKAEKNVKGCQKAKAAATASLKATRSSSACRAGGQGLDASSKDVHRPQKRSSFSSKETVNDKIVVKVSNLSDVIPWEIVDRLLMACGALDKGDFEETSGAKVYWFPTYKSALLAEGQLKGLRLLDKILNVKVMCNKSDGEPVLSLDEEMKIRNHALLVLGDYENIMVSVAKTIAESGVNVYSFKTQLCTKESCSSQQLCHDYHSAEDRRRNPLLYNYSSTMCRVVQSNKECNRHEECEDAHSTVEILFHKTKFRSHICIGWSTLRACPMTDKVCPFAHPDCPDLFFHPDWENLYVEGLHNTLLFLSGAILNHFRLQLPGSQKEIDYSDQRSIPHVRILVITPSADMVKLYVQAVKELALTCNMEVAAVTLETVTPADSSVLIGTPASLSKLLAEEKSKTSQKSPSEKVSGTISNIRAIILDDVSSVLKEFSSVSSHQALKRLLSAPGINKVAVSEVISFSEVHKTSRLFSCKLKELPVREQPQSDSIKISKEVYESAALRIPKRTFSPVQDQACLSTLSTPPLGKLLDKSKSGNVTHMPTVAHAQRYDLIDESAPLSPVSDTETVLYSCGGRSPLQSSSPSSSTSASPRKGFESEKSLNLPQEPLLSAKRQRTSHSSRGEVSSSQCRKKLRSSYFSRDHSPSSSSSSRDYPSHYAFPKYNENFLEDGLSQRHKSKPSNRRHKSFHHNSEDELSPLSEHSTRKHSRSNSHRRKSQLPEQSPRRWKASSRHGNHSSDRHTQRHESRSPKRSSRRRKRSSDRSEKYNSKSPEVSPKRKRYHSNEYEERRLHHSSSQDSKKRHKCKKHLSKHFCSSSVRKRETSLSSILLKEELPKDDGKGKNGLEDAATRPSYRVQKPSDTDVQSAPPLKKQSNSKEVGKTIRSTAKEASSAATQLLKPEEGPVLLDKVPSWGEVTKHQIQQNSLVLKNKDVLSRESCKKPEKDIATSSMPSPCETCRIKFDPVTDEDFLKLEKTLKEMHTTDYQVFLDSPEVHPDYDSSYMMFEQYYQQRYGDEGSNEKRESVWNMFWAELVRDQEIEEWTVKREGLLKHFENDRKQNCKCASKVKESLSEENEYSSDSSDVIFISESIPSNSKSLPNAPGSLCLANPSSVADDSEGIRNPQTSASSSMEDSNGLVLNLTSEKDLDPLLSESLTALSEVCDSLGEFFGSLIKKVIGRVREFRNTREAFLYLGKRDTIKLLEMTEEKIRGASITAEGSEKSKLFYGGQLIKRLVRYASQASTSSELDISQLAKATMNQDTSVVLNMIRERMKTRGIKDPPVDTVR